MSVQLISSDYPAFWCDLNVNSCSAIYDGGHIFLSGNDQGVLTTSEDTTELLYTDKNDKVTILVNPSSVANQTNYLNVFATNTAAYNTLTAVDTPLQVNIDNSVQVQGGYPGNAAFQPIASFSGNNLTLAHTSPTNLWVLLSVNFSGSVSGTLGNGCTFSVFFLPDSEGLATGICSFSATGTSSNYPINSSGSLLVRNWAAGSVGRFFVTCNSSTGTFPYVFAIGTITLNAQVVPAVA